MGVALGGLYLVYLWMVLWRTKPVQHIPSPNSVRQRVNSGDSAGLVYNLSIVHSPSGLRQQRKSRLESQFENESVILQMTSYFP